MSHDVSMSDIKKSQNHYHETRPKPLTQKSLHDECGVVAVSGGHDASTMVYFGLYALQHRGQESCGIAVYSDQGDSNHSSDKEKSIARRREGKNLIVHKDFGLVSDTFTPTVLSRLPGDKAIGHEIGRAHV